MKEYSHQQSDRTEQESPSSAQTSLVGAGSTAFVEPFSQLHLLFSDAKSLDIIMPRNLK